MESKDTQYTQWIR